MRALLPTIGVLADAAPPVRMIEGYAAIFGEPDLGGEIVEPGAFADSLRRCPSVPMLWMHAPEIVVGRWLEIAEDGVGLRVVGLVGGDVRVPAESLHRMLGEPWGLSIGFKTLRDRYATDGRRHLAEISLWEISIAPMPMQTKTMHTVRMWI